ncbi:hypothetical protein BKA65DRAFT_546989 [Rhexocercosporidium sp. MPI-PUGE-AT-0058]|nr:hypothetical protein BKA65DRAFT_546989 [Rhexocercosporidium sp. MPI-PUGE-AT-0058]
MAAIAQSPFQPAVNTAPPSPTSSTSTVALAPRPVHLAASGLWKPTPTLTQKRSHPIPKPAPTTLSPSTPTSTPLTTIPRSTATPTSISAPISTTAKIPQAPAPALTTSTTPRSILKSGDIHPANRPPAYSPTTTSSKSSSSLNYTSKPQTKTTRRSRGQSLKEGAFFAFVLLPLSCWYTRGGKRLRSGSDVKMVGGRKGQSEILEWSCEGDEIGGEEERSARRLPELRRPSQGRRDSLGQVSAPGVGGGLKGQVVGRRQSFSVSVPAGVNVGHGRSNSFSSVSPRGAGMGKRREVSDYGVDRGAAAIDGEWDLELEREMEREVEFERLRLSRAKIRTGSPVPLRRRRSEV